MKDIKKTGIDFILEIKELRDKSLRLENEINKRLSDLCKRHPDAWVNVLVINNAGVEKIRNKDITEKANLITEIEEWIASKNQYNRQLEIEFPKEK